MFDLIVGAIIFALCYGVVHVTGNCVPETRKMDRRSRFAMQLVMAMGATAAGYIIITGVIWHA